MATTVAEPGPWVLGKKTLCVEGFLPGGITAVDHQFAARHKLGFVAGQIEYPIGNIFRFTYVAYRMQSVNTLAIGFGTFGVFLYFLRQLHAWMEPSLRKYGLSNASMATKQCKTRSTEKYLGSGWEAEDDLCLCALAQSVSPSGCRSTAT